jgi:Tol biopolymer transport system component
MQPRFSLWRHQTLGPSWCGLAVAAAGRISKPLFLVPVAALLGGVADSPSRGSTAAGLIAFMRPPPSQDTYIYPCRGTVYTIQADAADLKAVGEGGCPDWSPDGTRLAVAAARGIFVIDTSGGSRRQLTRNPAPKARGGDGYPVWSPDGKKIAFIRIRFGRGNGPSVIYVVPANGGRLVKVAVTFGDIGGLSGNPDLSFGQVSWSPNSRRIAYARCVAPSGRSLAVGCHLETVGAGGRGRRKGPPIESRPDWSPNGPQIAVVQLIGNHRVLRLIRDGVKGGRRLLRCGCLQPKWSPDGHQLAFVDADGRLSIVSSGGGQVRRLTGRDFSSSDFAWSPDGREIAFIRWTDTVIYDSPDWRQFAKQVEIARTDGSGTRTIDSGPNADANVAWRPSISSANH